MENMKFWCITYTVVTLLLINGVHLTASSESPAPATYNCNDLIYDMADCLGFLSNGDGSDAVPLPSCCSGFQEVLNDDADCVCEGLKNAGSLGISINMTKAAALPSLCKVSAPPISSCNLSPAPVPSPGPSPANPPATNPPTTTPPTNNPPANNPPTTNPPADSPPSTPSTPPSTPPPASATPPPTTTPSPPPSASTSPSSGSPEADSPAAASIAPSSHHKGSGTSTMPNTMLMFLAFSIMAVGSFLV